MNKLIILVLTAYFFILASCNKPDPEPVNIIPQPESVEVLNEKFQINDNTVLVVDHKESFWIANYFAKQVETFSGMELVIFSSSKIKHDTNLVIFQLDNQEEENMNSEAYLLNINENLVTISADNHRGLFWGVQSLIQLMPPAFYNKNQDQGVLEIQGVRIKDKPRFGYRGMHLDVCRHMFPVEFIKQYIDLLAFYKFNTFHWHLTEDQGWRIEIKKYPELMEVSAFRDSTLVGHYRDKPHKWDGERYGGYYTQQEVREIVQYATDRNITIIPEIEMPGHSKATLAAYPELSCTGGPFRPATLWGVFEDVYCPKDETFEFLENVLSEVMQLFPGEYIHIGGDECPKTRWKNCDHCQELMKKEGLESEDELQSYFIRRIEKFLNKNGKKLIGWDEILEGGLSPNATVMSWRGITGGIAAAKQGHDAIMTPGTHCYFDHYQDSANTQPLAIGGLTTLKKVYHYEPIPDELTEEQAHHILGAQANVWTEYIKTPQHVEYMILPRMAALSEVNWSKPEGKNWEGFKKRVKHHFAIYDELGLNYYPEIKEYQIITE